MRTNHAHVEAAIVGAFLTLLVYSVSWLMDWPIAASVAGVPTILLLFMVFYLLLYPVLYGMWRR